MKAKQTLIGLLLVIGTSVAAGHGLSRPPKQAPSTVGKSSSHATEETLPKDIYPDTGNRFPPIKREELDEIGKKLYDTRGPGPFGPRGIRLYSPPVADYLNSVNDYLRHKSGLDPRVVELAILVTAREMDSEYLWTTHEPIAQETGLDRGIINTVKYRTPLTTVSEKEAAIIQLGRESFGKHKVSSNTFARALKLFGNQGLVNVISLMGDYASIAILLNASDQHVRPGDKPQLPIP